MKTIPIIGDEKSVLKIPTIYFFIAFTGIVLAGNYYLQHFLLNENLYFQHFRDQLSANRILELLQFRSRYEWLNYLTIPLFYLLKFFTMAVWMYCGLILYNYKGTFSVTFKVIVVAEYIWFIPMIITLFYFSVIKTNYTLTDIQYFQPLSLMNIFEYNEIDEWMIFPLKSLNLFVLFHLVFIALIFSHLLNIDFDSTLSFTTVFYGLGYIIWIAFITFLIVNIVS